MLPPRRELISKMVDAAGCAADLNLHFKFHKKHQLWKTLKSTPNPMDFCFGCVMSFWFRPLWFRGNVKGRASGDPGAPHTVTVMDPPKRWRNNFGVFGLRISQIMWDFYIFYPGFWWGFCQFCALTIQLEAELYGKHCGFPGSIHYLWVQFHWWVGAPTYPTYGGDQIWLGGSSHLL